MIKSPFKPPLTFLNLPLTTDFAPGDIAVVGLPFDCGNSATRFGCRLGPNAVRQASILTADLLTDAEPSPLESRRVIDAGDIDLPIDDIHAAFDAIERGIREIVEAGATPLTIGGDGAVSLPVMRAMRQRYPDMAVLHLDAHTDAGRLAGNDHHDNGTQFTHALNEGLIDVAHAIHVGTRGPVNAMKAIGHARSMGYEVIPFDVMREWGEKRLLEHLHARLEGRPLYLCFDMDVFDPSVAPGVATPTPGGLLPAD
ncbi:MAG: arginase family protein, partial [Alphaproteobacteria bacterium]